MRSEGFDVLEMIPVHDSGSLKLAYLRTGPAEVGTIGHNLDGALLLPRA